MNFPRDELRVCLKTYKFYGVVNLQNAVEFSVGTLPIEFVYPRLFLIHRKERKTEVTELVSRKNHLARIEKMSCRCIQGSGYEMCERWKMDPNVKRSGPHDSKPVAPTVLIITMLLATYDWPLTLTLNFLQYCTNHSMFCMI